jgi:hypothetical protein
MRGRSTRLLVDERSACPLSGSAVMMCVRSGAFLHPPGPTKRGQFDLAAKPQTNDQLLRIPAEDLSRRRFGSGGAVKVVGTYTAEVRGSNPLRSTR